MPKIIRVDVLDDDTLDIELSNGNLILFNVRLAARAYRDFGAAIAQFAGQKPLTDGARIYWRGGPSLTLGQILDLLFKVE